jgi:hypothetical protein
MQNIRPGRGKKVPRKKLLGLKYRKLLEMTSFFPPHTNLGVDKHHVLGNRNSWRCSKLVRDININTIYY